jgi:hypothetical protein
VDLGPRLIRPDVEVGQSLAAHRLDESALPPGRHPDAVSDALNAGIAVTQGKPVGEGMKFVAGDAMRTRSEQPGASQKHGRVGVQPVLDMAVRLSNRMLEALLVLCPHDPPELPCRQPGHQKPYEEHKERDCGVGAARLRGMSEWQACSL